MAFEISLLVLHKPEDYKVRVSDYVRKYATEAALKSSGLDNQSDASDDESTVSDVSFDQDMEMDDNMEM